MAQKYRARDVLVGLFVVAGVVAVVLGIFWIRGIGVGATKTHLVRYENVSSVTVGSAVKYHGMLVGRVRHLEIDPEVPERIRATLEISADVPVTDHTIAQLQKSDLLGDEYVDLRPAETAKGSARSLRVEGEPLPPGAYIQAGEPFDLGEAMRSAQETIEHLDDIVSLLRDDAHALLDKVQAALDDTRELVGPENRQAVADTLRDVRATASSTRSLVVDNREDIDVAIEQTREAIGQLRRLAETADVMLTELRPEVREAVQSLKHTADSADVALVSVGDVLDQLDARQVNMLLENLESTTRNLNDLTRDLKDRPYLLLRPQKHDVKGLPQ